MKKVFYVGIFNAIPIVAASLLMAAPVAAEGLVDLSSNVKVERSVTESGVSQIRLAEPEDVVPGDRLVFSTSYRNDSGEAVQNFVVTNPIPSAVALSQDDSSFEVSVDGGKTYAPLASLSVSGGESGPRPAEPTDVTHLRWTLASIAPGQSGTLTYHAIVR